MPEFYAIFARKINKMPEFYSIFARKIVFARIWGQLLPYPPSPTPMSRGAGGSRLLGDDSKLVRQYVGKMATVYVTWWHWQDAEPSILLWTVSFVPSVVC